MGRLVGVMKSLKRFRWTIAALGAIAAAAAIRQFGGGETVERDGLTFLSRDLAEGLEQAGQEPGIRVLTAFEDSDGVPCRGFLASGLSGVACKERGGWHLRVGRPGVSLDDPAEVAATERALTSAAERMTH